METRRITGKWALVLFMGLGLGCGDSDDRLAPAGPGQPDRVRTAFLSVDEARLSATTDGEQLRVVVPVTAARRGRGTIDVSVQSADGQTVLDRTEIPYRLENGESARLEARLDLPEDIEEQADRAGYVIRVSDGRAGQLQVTKSLLYALAPQALRVEGPARLRTGKQGSYRVHVEDPLTRAPAIGTEVTLVLSKDDAAVRTLSEETDDTGSAVFEVDVEQEGNYEVAASVADQGLRLQLVEDIEAAAPGQKLLLTTDKPIYQPGQVMHLRALALTSPSNAPVANGEITFEVEDGKGNKVLKKAARSDAYGIASTRFAIANVVNEGTYKVRAIAEHATGEKAVTVSRYALPKFDVQLSGDKPWYRPGATVSGTLDARYFFGKKVAGARVTVEALALDVGENVFARTMGVTDEEGHMGFVMELPEVLAGIPLQEGNALVTLRATVVDSAGQTVEKELALTVAAQPVRLSLVPEATSLVPGLDNRFHLFASDPLGAPIADAEVEVTHGGQTSRASTDAFGHVQLRWTPKDGDTPRVRLTTAEGETVSQTFSFEGQSGEAHVLVRTDKSVYAVGETAQVQVLASAGERVVYVDWLNQGQAMDMRTLSVQDGQASFAMPLDQSLLGENRIEAYVVDDEGTTIRAGRSLIVNRQGALRVALSRDQAQYAPGEDAKLTLSVTDETGDPVAAALGVQIVDEAVFGLVDARPGLLRTFFEIEDAFAEPRYEIHGPEVNFEKLLFEDVISDDAAQANAAQAQAEASLAALGRNPMMGLQAGSWSNTLSAAETVLAPFYEQEQTRLVGLLEPKVTTAVEQLQARGCTADQYYCDTLQQPFVEALGEQLMGQLIAYDFWGNSYQEQGFTYEGMTVVSAGPDEMPGTDDDHALTLSNADFPENVWGTGAAWAGLPGGQGPWAEDGLEAAAGGAAPPRAGAPTDDDGTGGTSAAGENGPRVRKDFPETLYVNPALITDRDGKASIDLTLADSITEWRLTAMANSQDGQLGGGQAGVTVFQDFFVDIDFPAELTRGDEVEFPVILYNYLQDPQEVRIALTPASWYTALGQTALRIELAPGEVRGVRIPVRVETVGVQTLTVTAEGQNAADAVARTVRVVPDGLAVPLAQSGSAAPGETTLTASFPPNAVAGSPVLYLDLFPSFLSQAVQGLDSILQVPHGCFEQTTSTTWPNVLVTRYMEETGQSTPELQLKAESLISAGYQRLLTFEHAGGGFSWFGEQDPAPFLSVTAFGVMEFADMAKVRDVDSAMRARTRDWLVDQQEGDGSWPGDTSEFFSFQTSVARNTAFVVWALAQDGYEGPELQRGLSFVGSHLGQDEDAYTLALAANAYAEAAPNDAMLQELLQRLDAMKTVDDDGLISWDSAGTRTNFYCGGNDAAVATTALVTHALITAGGYAEVVKGALDFITAAKDPAGNFGSTQATVWSLKTLLLAALKGTEGAIGQVNVAVDGAPFADVELREDEFDVLTRIDMSTLATRGTHEVSLDFAGTGKVSYNLVSSHHVPWLEATLPDSSPLALSIAYDRTALSLDETVEATVHVQNNRTVTHNMVLVTLGIPPGFEVLTEDLDPYKASGTLSHYELTGKQLTLYLASLPGRADQVFKYRLRATMPVRAADGGGEVHLYYEPEQRAEASSQLIVATAP